MPTIMYEFDPVTYEYIGSREAQIVGGKELIESASATTVEPSLPVPEGYALRWTGASWEILEDHRQFYDEHGVKQGGTKYWLPDAGDDWTSQGRYMTELGPLPEGAVLEKPEKPFDVVKRDKLNELNSGLIKARASSQSSLMSSVGFEINANDTANTNITGLINSMELTSTETAQFMAFDNTLHEVTLSDLKTMQVELALWGQTLYAYKWSVRDQIDAATTTEELNAIVIDYSQANTIYASMVSA